MKSKTNLIKNKSKKLNKAILLYSNNCLVFYNSLSYKSLIKTSFSSKDIANALRKAMEEQ